MITAKFKVKSGDFEKGRFKNQNSLMKKYKKALASGQLVDDKGKTISEIDFTGFVIADKKVSFLKKIVLFLIKYLTALMSLYQTNRY